MGEGPHTAAVGRRRVVAIALVALAVLLIAGGVLAHGWFRGWFVSRLTPADLDRLLEPTYEVLRPEGDGPFPAIVQLSGCAGVWENQRTWARVFRDAGWVSVLSDSVAARGLSWESVCGGTHLLGSERAGDVLVALAHARELPFVDRERIVLAGWSHGGWAIMDLLAMDPPRELPHNLSEMPAGGLSGLVGLLFVYPYCGFGTRSETWSTRAPAMFLMAEHDEVVSTEDCLELASALEAEGHRVRIEILEGALHSFDEPVCADGRTDKYDPGSTRRAHELALGFLTTLGGPEPEGEGR
jgi:dienelactone hydrolase